MLYHGTFFNIDNVFNGQRDLHTVAVVVRSKDYLLECFDPFFGASNAICFEIIHTLIRDNREIFGVCTLFLVQGGRDAVTEIDVTTWKIEV